MLERNTNIDRGLYRYSLQLLIIVKNRKGRPMQKWQEINGVFILWYTK